MNFSTFSTAVRQVSSEFLLGYIQGMDGEKDPRNLLIVFSTIPVITKHLDFSKGLLRHACVWLDGLDGLIVVLLFCSLSDFSCTSGGSV